MASRVEGEVGRRRVEDRFRRKLTDETAEVVGGVAAGSLTFIGVYESLLAGGMQPPTAFIAAAGLAAGAAGTGELAVHQLKRGLRDKGKP